MLTATSSRLCATWVATVLTAIGVNGWATARAALPSDAIRYCNPLSTQFDPADVNRPSAPPPTLPPGFRRGTITVAGLSTPTLEAGPRSAREAVVFLHGNPGSSLDYLGILKSVPKGARVLAFDMFGFGRASKPFHFPYTLEASTPLLDQILRGEGIERVHFVGHDVGSIVGTDWAAAQPDKLASAVLLAGGIVTGYTDHHFARIWKLPEVGELSMLGMRREGFKTVVQAHNPRPLPDEFIDRNYDDFDRATRCAILKAYRGSPDLSELGEQHAAALRPYDRPALVIWGDSDPFFPQRLAYSNRQGFPHADVHIYKNSGHWPFVDEEQRTIALMRRFFRRHVHGG